ncbi:NAD(P)/FAD-dependent oxidoreductase [Lentilactobacillus senioris]|uniref:NAD(P)/FAD-dependent oxidoreductase n=1 Tax=Lentilactobacillus senioris TaxID=931534 RepID=UPI0022806B87|nr:NAD(P)/FAD-dependent oxidoreductase [Lentilactobacillus senioris]MCY9806303.1 NAD(P)/FAD-dependent oxidoreductase [Lentilactobacillus senioris]
MADYEITIIGGGPSGIFAAFYAGLRNAKVQLIESLPELGGQVTAIYPEKTILDIGGYPQIKGRDLIEQQEAQLAEMDVDVKLGTTVTNVKQTETAFEIITNQGITTSQTVIVATGVGAFNPRKLAVDNGADFEGSHLFYSVRDLEHFRDREVLVAGGGDAAIDEALMLTGVASQVYLLHRRDQFRALESAVDRLNASSIKLITPYLIKGLELTDDQRVKVTAKKMRTEAEMTDLVVDDIVVNYGFSAENSVLDNWDVKLTNERGQILADQGGNTEVAGIYAIGDVATFADKQALIATGMGEAPLAVNSAFKFMDPNGRGPMHSTSIHLK